MKEGQQGQIRVVGIDGLRALAALAVFFCHINGYWTSLHLPGKLPQLLQVGAHGVDLFVVISGFCLALSVVGAQRALNLRQFLGRRAFRILPAYYVALCIATVLAMLPTTYHFVVADQADWLDFGAHALAIQTWVPATLGKINGSLWSVSLEIQLYIVFPLLVVLWRRFGYAKVLVCAAALSLSWEALGLSESTISIVPPLGSPYVLPDRLVQFCAGAFCAYLVSRRAVPSVRYLVIMLIAGFVAAGSMSTLDITFGHSVLWAIPSAAAVLLITGTAGTALARTPLNSLGRISYSFYLLHQPIILLLAVPLLALPGGWVAQFVIGSATALAAASGAGWILFRLVELPSHRLGRALFHPRAPAVLPTPAA